MVEPSSGTLGVENNEDMDDYDVNKDSLKRAWAAVEQAQRKAEYQNSELEHALEHNEELLHRIQKLEKENKELQLQRQDLLSELNLNTTSSVSQISGSTGDTSEKGDTARQLDMALKKQLEALEARDNAIHERDEALHEKDAVVRNSNNTVSSLRAQLQQLQQHCSQMHMASKELQQFMEVMRHENACLQNQVEELEEIVTANRQANQQSSLGGFFSCIGDRKVRRISRGDESSCEGDSLALELKGANENDDGCSGASGSEAMDRVKSNRRAGRSESPMTRVRSNSATTNKLQQLQKDYQQTFEKQQQQLEDAMKRKQLIEAEKDRELQKLHMQIKALEEKCQAETASPGAIAGLLGVLDHVRELTLEASDAVVLNLVSGTDRSSAVPTDLVPEGRRRIRRLCSHATLVGPSSTSSARDRLHARRARQKKLIAGEHPTMQTQLLDDTFPELPNL